MAMINPKSVRREGVKVEIESGAGFASLGCPRNTVNINDRRNTETLETFCTAQDELIAKITGGRDVTVSTTLVLLLSGSGQAAAETAYTNNDPIGLKITLTSFDGATTKVFTFEGMISQWSIAAQQNGVAEINFEYVPSGITVS